MLPDSASAQAFTKFVRNISPGDYLFRQGDGGNALFIVVTGEVSLFHRGPKAEHLIETLRAGQVLGEDTLFKENNAARTYTALAKTKATVLEISAQDIKTLQLKLPDFQSKLIKQLSERLDLCHSIINILQAEQLVEKVVLYLIFLAKQQPKDHKAFVVASEVQSALNIPAAKIEEILAELENQKVVSKKENGYCLEVPDSLMDHLTELKEFLAA